MKTSISNVLSQVRANTDCVPSSTSEMKTLGDPNCPHCAGAGYVRFDVPLGHEKFGKLESCLPCKGCGSQRAQPLVRFE